MEVDLRSGDAPALRALEKQFRQAVQDAVAEENTRWHSQALTVVDRNRRHASGRPCAADRADRSGGRLGLEGARICRVSFAEGSTDANLPLSLGIPALTIDTGGRGKRAHTENETFDATDAWKGTQRALLLSVVLAQP